MNSDDIFPQRKNSGIDLFDILKFKRGKLGGQGPLNEGTEEMVSLFYSPRWTEYENDPSGFLGIALGLAISGSYVPVGSGVDEEIKELVKAYDPKTVFHLSDDRSDLNMDMMRGSDLIEIDYTNPGSPYILPELQKRKDIVKLVDLVKELTGKKVSIRVPSIDIDEDIDHILVSDADVIVVDCISYGIDPCSIPHPVISTLKTIQQMEIFHSKRKGVKLVIDAGVRGHEDIMKLLSLGADMIGTTYLARSFLSDPSPDKDWADIGERFNEDLDELRNNTKDLFLELADSSMDRLRKQGLLAGDYNTASITGLPLLGYGKPLPIWRH